MYVKVACNDCGKTKVKRLGVYVNCHPDKLELESIEVQEELDEEVFLESIKPFMGECCLQEKTENEIYEGLRNGFGLSHIYALDIINRMKLDKRVKFQNGKVKLAG